MGQVWAPHFVGMKTETNPLSVLDPLVTITELADYLGVPVRRPTNGTGLAEARLASALVVT